MVRRLISGVALGSAVALLGGSGLAAAAPAPAYEIASEPGPAYHVGLVTQVYDGDTIRVAVDGDNTTSSIPIRLLGLQAMELRQSSPDNTLLRGQCHAAEATVRLRQLVLGRIVRIWASHDGTALSRERPWRSVSLYDQDRWVDVGEIMVREGMALPVAHVHNYAYNLRYFELAEQAAAAKRGIYNPQYCRVGPAQSAELKVRVNWKRRAGQPAGPNHEFVRIRNVGTVDAPIGRWWVRNWDLNRYRFPQGTVVKAGQRVTLYVGSGTDTDKTFYWGLKQPTFKNVTGAPKYLRDAGYLFDKHGDLRGYHFYS
jgi:endonuclease YncB( thermonuclease family)